MEQMKHQDGFAPSAEDTAKLNEIVTWLTEHGYKGMMLIHNKDGVGISWVREDSGADAIRNDLINALGHIYDEDANAATDLAKGIILAAAQLQN